MIRGVVVLGGGLVVVLVALAHILALVALATTVTWLLSSYAVVVAGIVTPIPHIRASATTLGRHEVATVERRRS